MVPQLEPLAEQQQAAVNGLRKSSQQAEDALSQGMEKLQQTLSETLMMGTLGGPDAITNNYMSQMGNALGKLEDLVTFVNQVMIHFHYYSLFDDILFSVMVKCLFLNSRFQNDLWLLVLLCMIDCQCWLFHQQWTYIIAKRKFKPWQEKKMIKLVPNMWLSV